MNTILTEKNPKKNIFFWVVLGLFLVSSLLTGYTFYKHNKEVEALLKTNAEQLATLQQKVDILEKTLKQKDAVIADLNNQLYLAKKESQELSKALEEKNLILFAMKKKEETSAPATPQVSSSVISSIETKAGSKVEKVVTVVYFDFNSSKIRPEYKDELLKISKFISSKNAALFIEGHTDSIGNKDYNVWLSGQRAESVKNEILAMTTKPPCNIISIGVGDTKNVKQNIPNKEKRKVIITAIEDCKF